jgi:hypothetical protein
MNKLSLLIFFGMLKVIYLVDTICVFAAVVHLGLGAFVEVGDPGDRIQRAVDEQTTVTDVVVASLQKNKIILIIPLTQLIWYCFKRLLFFVLIITIKSNCSSHICATFKLNQILKQRVF